MPLDAQGAWQRDQMVTAEQILTALSGSFELTATDPSQRGAAPAQTWYVGQEGPVHPADGNAAKAQRPRVGIVASVTRPFCGDCDRTRLTADGQIRDCLFARGETDLRDLLRGGADDDRLVEVWRAAMWAKQPGHGINDPSFLQPDRPMSAIGG
jgi:cyclic pyranopterin phosphate synthase